MIQFNPSGVCEELKASHRWVLWQLEDVQDGDKLRKDMKPPYNARSGHPAKHNDPKTWSTYEEAVTAHTKRIPLTAGSNTVKVHNTRGVGVVIGPPFFGIDLDDCRDATTGEINEEALAWIRELQTLTEISPSGTGVHLWCHGEPPYREGHRKDGREIYSCNRYLTVTGAVLEGFSEIRRFTTQEVKKLYDRVKAGRGNATQCGTRAEEPSGTYTAAKIQDMMTKSDFPDLSQAVQSLLTLLAIEHTCDREKIETEFKKSRLYLDTHWHEKWERLRDKELSLAIEHARENIQKRLVRKQDEEPESRSLSTSWMNTVTEKPLLYMWEPVLPLGKLVHFAGRSSEGKSPVTLDLIARITRGDVWPDGQPNTRGPKRAILLNIEDGLEDMIAPRFTLAGGIKESLCCVRGVKIKKKDTLRDGLVALDKDIALLCELARAIPDLGIIVIDPITNYLGKLKMNAEDDVRHVLTPLAGLAEELNIVVLTVGHLNKNSETTDPLARIMGAAAFAGVARSVYLFGEDRDSENKYAHIMSPARSKEASYHYATEQVEIDFNGVKSGVIKVVWGKTSEKTAEEVQEEQKITRTQVSKEKEAALALRDMLKAGKRSAQDCELWLKANGYDGVNTGRIRSFAKVFSRREGGKNWWMLPTAEQLFEVPAARKDSTAPSY